MMNPFAANKDDYCEAEVLLMLRSVAIVELSKMCILDGKRPKKVKFKFQCRRLTYINFVISSMARCNMQAVCSRFRALLANS